MLRTYQVDPSEIVPDSPMKPRELQALVGTYSNESGSSEVVLKDGNSTRSLLPARVSSEPPRKTSCTASTPMWNSHSNMMSRVAFLSMTVRYPDYSYVLTKVVARR